MHIGNMEQGTLNKFSRGYEIMNKSEAMATASLEQVVNAITSVRSHLLYSFRPFPALTMTKAGDTTRPSKRLLEWKEIYPEMVVAENCWISLDFGDLFIRDLAVHQWLKEHGYYHVQLKDIPVNPETGEKYYYSNEIFDGISHEILEQAVAEIKQSILAGENRYSAYRLADGVRRADVIQPYGPYTPRPNQQLVIDRFFAAAENGIRRMLMFAPPRFGKTFTSLMILMAMKPRRKGRFCLALCGKADTRNEWHDTVIACRNFRDKGVAFVDSADMDADHNIITRLLDEGKDVVAFCTLADFAGSEIKLKHNQIFENYIDLLIVDETHFGARAEEYGYKLPGNNADGIADIYGEIEDAREVINRLENVGYELHLSGTPYRILMTDEFDTDSVIYAARYTESIILRDQWYIEHPEEPEENNPYYGIPDMINLGFDLADPASAIVREMRRSGLVSVDQIHEVKGGKFVHEDLVLRFWKSIAGTEADALVIGLLSAQGITTKGCGCHVVVALPRCAACDALEKLLKKHAGELGVLGSYEVVNISSAEGVRDTDRHIKERISKAYREGRNTLTLTVNRMLTGSTVPEWDTMLYMKGGKSPQDYDQAKCRLMTAFTRKYTDADGNTVKVVEKPTVVFVDFDYGRMFEIEVQGIRSMQFLDPAAAFTGGIDELKAGLEKSTKAAPILLIKHVEEGFHEVEPIDILTGIAEYQAHRGIMDSVDSLVIGFADLDDDIRSAVKELLSRQDIGATAQKKVSLAANVNGEMEPDEEDVAALAEYEANSANAEESACEGAEMSGEGTGSDDAVKDDNSKELEKQYRSLCLKLLLFAFCTLDKVESLADIVSVSKKPANKRILRNFELTPEEVALFKDSITATAMFNLDFRIMTVNMSVRSTDISPIERARLALAQFTRISASEVVTPFDVAIKLVEGLSEANIKKIVDDGHRVLDYSSEVGEVSVAMVLRMKSMGYSDEIIRRTVCALPASPIAYEMVRRMYDLLGLDIDNIYANFDAFDAYDMIIKTDKNYTLVSDIMCQSGKKPSEITLEDEIGEDTVMEKFGAVVGNPPYQDQGGSGGNNDAAIYQYFVQLGFDICDGTSSFIIPARWFSGGRENLLGDFRKYMLTCKHIKDMTVYSDASDVFPDIELKGGSCLFSHDVSYEGPCSYTLIQDGVKETLDRDLSEFDILVREPILANILHKVMTYSSSMGSKSVASIVSNDTPFGIPSNPRTSKKHPFDVSAQKTSVYNTSLRYIDGNRITEYVKRDDIKKNAADVDKEKVFVPAAYGAGEKFPHQILGVPEYGDSMSVCSQSFLYAVLPDKTECLNFIKYYKTRTFRVIVFAAKIAQSAPRKVYRFVPMLDFASNSTVSWTKSIDDIDKQLYKLFGFDEDEIEFITSHIKPME